MKRVFLSLALALLFISPASAGELEYFKLYTPASGMSAEEIMNISYHNKFSLFAKDYDLRKSQVLYIDPSGFTREKLAERYRIVMAGKDEMSYKDLIVVTSPAQTKGLAILTWTYEDPKRDQDVWLWLPSLKKSRKISASEDDDAFMGSDLTVEEVSTRRLEDETYKLVGEKIFSGYKFEYTGEMKFQGTPCYVIEATPLKPRWYYAKRNTWITKDNGTEIFEEYFDKNGKLFKTIYRGWTLYDPQGKKYPTQDEIECKDLRTGHRTVIVNTNQKYDVGVSDQVFTVRTLQRSKW
jgi:hypothetical protein